jgi:predicted nuclease of predicted toxin-antitoxin system
MRILANENVPRLAVVALRKRGNDVLWARETHPGAKDLQVLAIAKGEARVLITFDKDFGELVFRLGRDASLGIVLFRISLADPKKACLRIVEVLESRSDWAGGFWVVEEGRLRMTPLPTSPAS